MCIYIYIYCNKLYYILPNLTVLKYILLHYTILCRDSHPETPLSARTAPGQALGSSTEATEEARVSCYGEASATSS